MLILVLLINQAYSYNKFEYKGPVAQSALIPKDTINGFWNFFFTPLKKIVFEPMRQTVQLHKIALFSDFREHCVSAKGSDMVCLLYSKDMTW